MKKITTCIITLFCMSLFVGIGAFAADNNPCADDAKKFCKDIKPGGGNMATCLNAHEKELSPACQQKNQQSMMKLKEAHKSWKETKTACAEDIGKFCKDLKPGKGQIAKCLSEHKLELSAQCTEKFSKKDGEPKKQTEKK